MDNKIKIEVTFATPQKQTLLEFEAPNDIDVERAIELSGILAIHKDIDLTQNKVGIWSRTCKLSQSVANGDRIEIYRPLIADPKEVRKRRAEKAIEEGRADKITGGRPNPRKKESQSE
jgi:uncharacterized protein